jgi:hypothetical protein
MSGWTSSGPWLPFLQLTLFLVLHTFASGSGDRLVFSNGMFVLAGRAGLLIIIFGGDTHALIPLFAVGVFLAFALSLAGMVVHWVRLKGAGW